jgi:putative transposase
LPDNEKAWLEPHRAIYLIGTEAPDNRTIRLACGVPHQGYDDRSLGHSVTWNASATMMTTDRPAVRAQEEYAKAAIAFGQGKPAHAAFFLGALAHYIGDVAQYGHSWPKPTDNATIESFNGRFREECLNIHWFASLEDAQQKIDAFRWDYNEHHPHRALKGLSPREYAQKVLATAAESPS